jgi:hypothetical protein
MNAVVVTNPLPGTLIALSAEQADMAGQLLERAELAMAEMVVYMDLLTTMPFEQANRQVMGAETVYCCIRSFCKDLDSARRELTRPLDELKKALVGAAAAATVPLEDQEKALAKCIALARTIISARIRAEEE